VGAFTTGRGQRSGAAVLTAILDLGQRAELDKVAADGEGA
jgi:hypothetical protein